VVSQDGDDGGRVDALARYSFVYKKVEGEWKIMLHHSSQQPVYQADEGLVSPSQDCIVGVSRALYMIITAFLAT